MLGSQAGVWLAKSLGSGALPEIRQLVKSDQTNDRLNMATAMALIDDAQATGHFCLLAKDKDEFVSLRAITGLEGRRNECVINTLIAVVSGYQSELVRGEAARVLGTLGDRAAFDALVAVLKKKSVVSSHAAVALGELGDERAIAELRAVGYFHSNIIPYAIRRIGGNTAATTLAELLAEQDDVAEREEIIRQLGYLHVAEVIPSLLLGLADADPRIRRVSREVLWFLPHSLLHDGLRIALTHPSPAVRRDAAAITPFYADETIVSELSRLAKDDPDSAVRTVAQSARDAIGEMGTQ